MTKLDALFLFSACMSAWQELCRMLTMENAVELFVYGKVGYKTSYIYIVLINGKSRRFFFFILLWRIWGTCHAE